MPIVFEGYGNVLTHEAQTITCPVNTVGIMGKGLALSMRNRFMNLNNHYKFLCQEGKLRIGHCEVFKKEDNDQQVLLFPTKTHWKDDSSVDEIEVGLRYLVKNIKKLNITSLAMIPLGCGLGRLDYLKEVRPLIVKYLDPLEIDVFLLHRDNSN